MSKGIKLLFLFFVNHNRDDNSDILKSKNLFLFV